jgi:hypothetical protein
MFVDWPRSSGPLRFQDGTNGRLDELVGWGDVLARELVTVRAKRHYTGARRMRRWFLPWQIACLLVRKPAE